MTTLTVMKAHRAAVSRAVRPADTGQRDEGRGALLRVRVPVGPSFSVPERKIPASVSFRAGLPVRNIPISVSDLLGLGNTPAYVRIHETYL